MADLFLQIVEGISFQIRGYLSGVCHLISHLCCAYYSHDICPPYLCHPTHNFSKLEMVIEISRLLIIHGK